MTPSEETSARAEALFVSSVQCSDNPTPAQVRAAVTICLQRHGVRGCAMLAAQEYGEHPLESVARMSWVLAAVRSAYGPPVPQFEGAAIPVASLARSR